MKYDFNKKGIKCENFTQAQHLEKLAVEYGYGKQVFNEESFDAGYVWFFAYEYDGKKLYTLGDLFDDDDIEISYADFINNPIIEPTVVEVSGCKGCPLRMSSKDTVYCLNPEHKEPTKYKL